MESTSFAVIWMAVVWMVVIWKAFAYWMEMWEMLVVTIGVDLMATNLVASPNWMETTVVLMPITWMALADRKETLPKTEITSSEQTKSKNNA